jgi:hypothetical protein
MREIVLYQQRFLDSGNKQFLDALDTYVSAYAEIILALFLLLFLAAAALAIMENREKRAGERSLPRRQKAPTPGYHDPRAAAYKALTISHDSIC